MKKLLSIGLAAMLAFGLATTSFAASDTDAAGSDNTTGSSTTATYTDQKTVTIQKKYKLTNDGTTSPAETFTLEQVDKKVKDGDATEVPDLGTITGAEFAKGAATVDGTTGNITVALPEYTNVGVYEYTLKEVAGTTAGVAYYPDDIRLVVTVINGENSKLRIAAVHVESEGAKSDTFPNTYSAGSLKVTKTVDGNLGDKTKYFEFTVTLTGVEGKTYADSYAVTGGSADAKNPTTIAVGVPTKFNLKHGDTITIENLPYDVTYTVTETPAAGYTTEKTGDTGKINAVVQTAAFTNTKNGEVDTGVVLNNMPYILVLAVLAAGVAVFIIRKRRED